MAGRLAATPPGNLDTESQGLNSEASGGENCAGKHRLTIRDCLFRSSRGICQLCSHFPCLPPFALCHFMKIKWDMERAIAHREARTETETNTWQRHGYVPHFQQALIPGSFIDGVTPVLITDWLRVPLGRSWLTCSVCLLTPQAPFTGAHTLGSGWKAE